MHQTIEKIAHHLESLGYSVERHPPEREGGSDSYFAKHPTKHNFAFWYRVKNSKSFILFRTSATTSKKFSDDMSAYI